MADVFDDDGTGQIPRLIPQSKDAEESVLGAVLLDNNALDVVSDLRTTDFYKEPHRRIFAAMLSLQEDGDPIDLVTLCNVLREREDLDGAGGELYLTYLAGRVPTAANVGQYAEIVKEKAQVRRVIDISQKVTTAAYEPGVSGEELLDRVDAELLTMREEDSGEKWVTLPESLERLWALIQKALDGDRSLTGLSTFLPDLDRKIMGLRGGELIVLAGRPSMGKTALALQIAKNNASRGAPALVFSMEMESEELTGRLVCAEAGVDSRRLRDGVLTKEQVERMREVKRSLARYPMVIDPSPALSVTELCGKARMFRRQHREGLGLIVIDYLQLMDAPKAERESLAIGKLTRALKRLAKGTGWPVLLLSQLNREAERRPDRRPALADLRESGSIEQDADVVLLLFRAEHYFPEEVRYHGLAEVDIAKNRNGPCGRVPLNFDRTYTRFTSRAFGAQQEDAF